MHTVTESHINDLCPRCRKPHGSLWKDEWHGEIHYQTTSCRECGLPDIHKKNSVLTSGKF